MKKRKRIQAVKRIGQRIWAFIRMSFVLVGQSFTARRIVPDLRCTELTPHWRLQIRLARRGQACDLPLPVGIYPDTDGWIIKVLDLSSLLKWARALGFKTHTVRMRYSGVGHRQMWVIQGVFHGITVVIHAPELKRPDEPSP